MPKWQDTYTWLGAFAAAWKNSGCDGSPTMKPITEKQLSDDMATATAAAGIQPGAVLTCPNDATEGDGTSRAGPTRLCSRCKKESARANQEYCRKCHSVYMRGYRSRQRLKLVKLRQFLDGITVKHSPTQCEFEKKLGKSRYVVVVKREHGELVPICKGVVTGFHPLRKLSVMNVGTGEILKVCLDEIEPDPGCGVWWAHLPG